MKKLKNVACIMLAALTLSAGLAGCTSDGTSDQKYETGTNEAVQFIDIDPKELLATSYTDNDAEAQNVAQGANDFAFRFAAQLAEQEGEGNFICSPYSLWLPLAALVNAVDKSQQTAVIEALGVTGVTVEDLNRASSRMLYDLTKERTREDADGDDYNNPLKIANAVFVQQGFTPAKGFAQSYSDYFRGNTVMVDFSSQDAIDTLNQWASDNTEGKIEHIVDGFDDNTRCVIANAIYFKDTWSWEFPEARTHEDTFYVPGGNVTAPFMMRVGSGQYYYEEDGLQAIQLGYEGGGGMLVLLPEDGDAMGLLATLDNEMFKDILAGCTRHKGTLQLPKFTIESDSMKLNDTMKALGSPLFADIPTVLPGLLIEGEPLVVTNAVQKAMIEVDEEGTTAAAVTVIEMEATAAQIEDDEPDFEMTCDRPFVFVLYDRTVDGGVQVLFAGMVYEP